MVCSVSIQTPNLIGLTGKYNLEEIERNLQKKFLELLPIYKSYLPKINLILVPFPTKKAVDDLAKKMSPKDAPVLASAQMGKADYLITGNKKDFPLSLVKPIHLVSPTEFLHLFGKTLNES